MSDSPLRMAIVRRSYRPDGGAERIISRTLAALSEQTDLDLSLICEQWQGESDTRHILCPPGGLTRSARHRHFVRQVQQVIQREAFDLVQSNERIPGCSLYRAGDGVHAQWLARRRTGASGLQRAWLSLSSFHRYMLATERELLLHPDLRLVVCNATGIRDDILRHYPVDPDKLRVVINGVDLDYFSPAEQPGTTALGEELGLRDAPTLLFVGSGFERKGLGELLHALSATRAAWQLVVVGRDKREKHYRRLAHALGLGPQVRFAGVQRDVRPYYALADLLVHPCLYEPFGNVVLEALACGRGAITNQYCGAAELLREGKNGLCYDANRPGTLAACLERAHGEHRDYRQAARLTAEAYSMQRMIDEMLDIYRELLDLPAGDKP